MLAYPHLLEQVVGNTGLRRATPLRPTSAVSSISGMLVFRTDAVSGSVTDPVLVMESLGETLPYPAAKLDNSA